MTVKRIAYTATYAWDFDNFMGVGHFERLSDGAQSPWETGQEARDINLEMIERFEDGVQIAALVSSDAADRAFDRAQDWLNTLAEGYEFS